MGGAPGVKKGGVVGIDYGGKSCSKMLLKHGVCSTDAAAEGTYEVSFSVSPMDKFQDDKLDILEIWGFMQEPVSMENEKMMLETLIATCEGCLSGFTTTDAEDAKALSGGSVREQRAAAVRRSEKAALKNTILILEEEIDSLEDKEYYQERRLRILNLDRPVDESEIVDPDIDIRRENIPFS